MRLTVSTFLGKIQDVEDSGQFMTMFFLALDTVTRQLEWVRAGQDPGIVYDPGSDAFSELGGSGIALGVDAEWIYEDNKKTDFSNGQIIFLSTDGIWEARNKRCRNHRYLVYADCIIIVGRFPLNVG